LGVVGGRAGSCEEEALVGAGDGERKGKGHRGRGVGNKVGRRERLRGGHGRHWMLRGYGCRRGKKVGRRRGGSTALCDVYMKYWKFGERTNQWTTCSACGPE
jgi:hypothetical protein